MLHEFLPFKVVVSRGVPRMFVNEYQVLKLTWNIARFASDFPEKAWNKHLPIALFV